MKLDMIRKHLLLGVLLICFPLFPAFSATNGNGTVPGCNKEWKEKMRSEKIAYFTAELDLTPEEAQKFWPVYNMLQEEKEKYHNEARECMKLLEAAISEGKPEKEIAELLDNYIEAAGKCDNICNRTREEISKVLSETKTARLFIAEERFMMKQFRSFKEKKDAR